MPFSRMSRSQNFGAKMPFSFMVDYSPLFQNNKSKKQKVIKANYWDGIHNNNFRLG